MSDGKEEMGDDVDEGKWLRPKVEVGFSWKTFTFDIENAWDMVSSSEGAKETTINLAKLAGKATVNAGVHFYKNLPGLMAEQLERQLRENHDMDPEKRAKAAAYVQKYKKK